MIGGRRLPPARSLTQVDRLHRFFPLLKRIADGRSFVILADDLAVWRGPRGYVENIAPAVIRRFLQLLYSLRSLTVAAL